MDWEAIAAVSETVSAAAVVVSLAYLALQVHQNTRVLKNQGLHSAIERFLLNVDELTRIRTNADVFRRGLNDFAALAPDEVVASRNPSLTVAGAPEIHGVPAAATMPTGRLV